jgi:hypothetical protein
MHGMKSLPSVLDVKTHRIDHPVSTGKHIGNCPLVVNVGLDRLQLRIIAAEQLATAIRVP